MIPVLVATPIILPQIGAINVEMVSFRSEKNFVMKETIILMTDVLHHVSQKTISLALALQAYASLLATLLSL